MDKPDKPLANVIPQILLDCPNVLDKRDLTISWKLTRHLKGFFLVIKTFGLKNVVPLKDCRTALRSQ